MWAFRAVRLGGRMAAGDALPRLLLGERAVLLAAVAGVTLVAWLYLLHLGHDMGGMADMGGMPDMAGMAMAPGWTPATAVLTLAMWVVMMTGMMLPSAAPMILTFAALHRREAAAERWVTTLLFVAGYLAVWAGFSLAATLLQWALDPGRKGVRSGKSGSVRLNLGG